MITTNPVIEEVLLAYRSVLGNHYHKYRNHVYRVFLNCLLLDTDGNHTEKYAYAAAFHDIGIWTNQTIDYLEPSISQACSYLAAKEKNELIADITLMIYWHHKVKPYKGISETIVENFRRADWIDVSLGLLHFKTDKKEIAKNRRTFPNLGFHWFLIKKLVSNFFRNPLHPLPMFRR